MKTKTNKKINGSTRSRRVLLYVGLATLLASVALQGAGLWLALHRDSSLAAGAALLAIAGGAFLCLAGTVLTFACARRMRGQRAGAPVAMIAPKARSGEEAAALAHARKMEALGLLAGGVAHDFNNLLHVIRNSLEILQREDPQVEPRRYLEMIRHSTEQATALTRQLLAFSRRQPLEVRPVDPNDLVTQMAELLRHSLGDRITVETVLGRGVGSVAADAGQLETALLNLAINARDAMSQAGLLTIETANTVLDEAAARSAHARSAYVMIAVSDTGSGMAPEVAARACEPFFTTKEPGQGTGLGLSQVAGFAQQTGGHLRISSEPGKGTTVRLYLPGSLPGAALLDLERKPGKRTARPASKASRGVPLAVVAAPEG